MDEQGTPYHWVLSINGSVGGRQATVGFNGVITVVPGQTRHQVYNTLRDQVLGEVQRQTGVPMDTPATIFFALEPDQF